MTRRFFLPALSEILKLAVFFAAGAALVASMHLR